MDYKIKIDQFEGPLDLLLQLIEEEKMDVTMVSIAKVADHFLEYFEANRGQITLYHLSSFLLVASKLLLIKSKALLPSLEFNEDEEEEIKDLEYQLAEFKKFKDIAVKVAKKYESDEESFSRDSFLSVGVSFSPPEDAQPLDLKKAFIRVLKGIPVTDDLKKEVVKDVVTLEQKVMQIERKLHSAKHFKFSEIVSKKTDRIEVVVSFLALLEMIKQKVVNVSQEDLFSDIQVERKGDDNNK